MIQDGGCQVRCARLTGDVHCAGAAWSQLMDVQRLDVEDASDDIMTSFSRHAPQLTSLQALSVTWTPMKQVPGSWSHCLLPRLVALSLTRDQLRSVDALDGGGSCGRLETLDVSHNLLDTLPRHFAHSMSRLTTLVLTGNALRSLPDGLGQMMRLRSLECASNKLTKLPASIGDLSELAVLDVSANNLTVLPDSIGQLGSLKHLRASANRLTTVYNRLPRITVLYRHLEHCPNSVQKHRALIDVNFSDFILWVQLRTFTPVS